jgi:ubiquitin-activating enzyme E1
MIGAGALGCEFMKQFALMGFSTGNGKVVVTDDDQIEISNLNR